MLGGCLPAGLVVLLEMIGTRYRRFSRAESELREQARLLGVLPTLPEWSNGNATESADAAHCLHQIRVALQVGKPRDRGATYLLSSATPGEGKTSVAAALGLAFAASGARTLLIDCDLVSGRLTRGFGLEDAAGVREAITDGTVGERVREAGRKNLWMLPAGRGDDGPNGGNGMSPHAAERMLAEAGRGFDVVMVDAGPILGSIEASAVAGRVDGVILVVARDQQRSLVDRAVRQLRAVRARIEGMIFNRAEPGDFQRSAYSYSYSSRSAGGGAGDAPQAVPVRGAAVPRLGPLVSSVSTCGRELGGSGDGLQV
jgi:Mrp family chromosome partitioning ATPase